MREETVGIVPGFWRDEEQEDGEQLILPMIRP
jgi:hypothetical protein